MSLMPTREQRELFPMIDAMRKEYEELRDKMKFYPMNELPERAKDLKGNEEPFSVCVLVFDKEEPTFANLGFYNFDTEDWTHHGEESMKLICWCYVPNPIEFMKQNKDLKHVLHTGYREK